MSSNGIQHYTLGVQELQGSSRSSKEGLPPTQKNEKQVVRYVTALSEQHKTWTFTAYQLLCEKIK